MLTFSISRINLESEEYNDVAYKSNQNQNKVQHASGSKISEHQEKGDIFLKACMYNAIIPFHLCQCRMSVEKEMRNLGLFELFGQLANQMHQNLKMS